MMKNLLSNYKNINRTESPSPAPVQPLPESAQAIHGLWEERKSVEINVLEKNDEDATLALLFIVIDSLPFEALWRYWIDSSPCSSRVHIFIHAKYPERVRSTWVKQHLVPFSYRPAWASVEIAKAMIKLLEYSMEQASSISKFVYLSESCLPVENLEKTLTSLRDSDSWVNWRSSADNGYSQQLQFAPLSRYFPEGTVLKADQWVCLNRHHAAAIVEAFQRMSTELWRAFSTVNAADEMVIPTMLSLLGFLRLQDDASDAISYNIRKRRVTYCEWNFSVDARHPTTYSPTLPSSSTNCSDFVTGMQLARHQSLFIRKVKCVELEAVVSCWLESVYSISDEYIIRDVVGDRNSDRYSASDDGEDRKKRLRHE